MPKNGRIKNKEKKIVAGILNKFFKISLIIGLFPVVAFGVQTPNPRGGNGRDASNTHEVRAENAIRRSATSVIARSVEKNGRKNRTVVKARQNASNSRNAVARNVRDTARVVTSNVNVSRGALANRKTLGLLRAAKNNSLVRSGANVSRAGTARATAVFSDISKIGGGYAACRDSYATCMDQFCANANDTYRRCYCSDRFTSFRDTSDSLDAALSMLADFQNNNLEAVNKTAAEVNAMYSASEGEAAIKRDTSASQKLLDDIGELLSGKKKYTSKSTNTAQSSGGTLNLSGLFGSGASDDVFGGGSIFDGNGGSLFSGSSNYENMSDLEGAELYNSANRQCSAISHDECSNEAMFNLARSAYSIMITQDCNLYEKNINAKKESVQETVRTAEKYLREARLEEYRAHNSPDVNSCLDKVESAIRQPTACGENYERCLDYSGRYINSVTGEPIYSKALFDLNNLIVLDGSADVVGANPEFNTFLEDKKIFVNQALDTCRAIADTVWYEFKRSAIIQIAQAQDAKIEEVKDSCVQTMATCYNTQSGALNEYGGERAKQLTGAISAIAAHDMCKDQVLACAALYGDPNACIYDDKSKTLKDNGTGTCGLKSLLAYVNTVDSVKVAEGCEISLRDYAKELCGDGTDYPWGCRLYTKTKLENLLREKAELFCGEKLYALPESGGSSASGSAGVSGGISAPTQTYNASAAKLNKVVKRDRAASNIVENTVAGVVNVPAQSAGQTVTAVDIDQNIVAGIANPSKIIEKIVNEIKNDLDVQLSDACYAISGEGRLMWVSRIDQTENGTYYGNRSGLDKDDILEISPGWMKTVFGTDNDLKFLDVGYYYVHGFTVSIPGTGLKKNMWSSSESRWLSTGWGLCIKPTTRLMCLAQKGEDGTVYGTYDKNTDKCTLKSDWYKNKCAEIGGYTAGSSCYISK